MWLPNWLRSWKGIAAPSSRPARRSKAPTTRLFLEPLEDRTLLSAGWAIASGGTGSVVGVPTISQPDTNGNSYVTGYFAGTITLGSTTLTAAANNTSFVAKMDPNGNVLWAEQFGGLSNAVYTGISLDPSGNVLVSGNFDGTQSFGPTTLTSTSTNATGYITKIDPNGNFLWAQRYAYQTGGSVGDRLATDANGNTFLCWYATPTTGNAGFLTKYDTNGNTLWTERLPNGGVPISVALDTSGDAYVGSGGEFLTKYDTNGNVIWSQTTPRPITGVATYQDPTTGATSLYAAVWPITAAPTDVERIDPATGAVLWSEQIGQPSLHAQAIATDANGNVLLIGQFSGTTDFDPGPGNATITSQAPGYSSDVILVKLNPSGNFLSVYDFGGNSNSEPSYVATDASGNILTTGIFNGPENFDTGSQIVQLPSTSNGNLFVVKTTQDTGMIFGRVFDDLNNNGVADPGEAGIPNVQVYLDLNNSGSYVSGDPTATTDSQGYYHFTDVTPGNYTLRQIAPSGYTVTPASFPVSVSAGQASETTGFADSTPNKTRTYSNTTAVSTSKGKPNAVSSLTVPDSYTVLGMTLTLNVSNAKDNTLSIFLTGPNGTKISLGSSNQNGTLTFQVPDFDSTLVKGPWKLEVDGLGQGGVLKSWSLSIDGTLS